jgi:hypothetical protein
VVRLLLLACFPLLAWSAPPGLVIESELSPARVYVGGEALLKLRLLRAPGVSHGVLRAPEMGDAADVSLVGSIRAYDLQRDGVAYEVIERTHVIVPRRAGRLVIPGAIWEGSLSFEIYNKETGTVPPTARGPARVLEVRAPPAGAGEPWLPARALALKESWSRDLNALSTGRPVTRTLVLRAEGLSAERLPRVEMTGSPALLVHHDQPELRTEYFDEGMVGERVQRIVLMPVGAGEVSLPEVRVPWWDVQADAPRVATLPGWNLLLHSAIAPVAPVPEAPVSVPALLRAVLAALVLAAGAGLWWHLRTRAARAARGKLRQACRRNDARGARDALAEWRAIAGAPPAAMARAPLAALDAALYAGRAWDGAACWRALKPVLRARRVRRAARRAPLPPLFALHARAKKDPDWEDGVGFPRVR